MQLQAAKQRLDDEERKAGRILTPKEAPPGPAELVEFWREELARLISNREYLVGLRDRFALSGESEEREMANAPRRLISRLIIFAPDVKQEARFWCEAVGMQRYENLPGGGEVVAYGPPSLIDGDEGGFFSLEIRPEQEGASATDAMAGDARLSFLQIAMPNQIRPYKVEETGGVFLDSYGYFQLQSPAGVVVRVYIDDRRDPVEFVALAAPPGEIFEAVSRDLESLGLRPRGSYESVSPVTQEFMPRLPSPNRLYAGGEKASLSAQLLLLPLIREQPTLYRTPQTLRTDSGSMSSASLMGTALQGLRLGGGEEEEEEVVFERPYSPLSKVGHIELVLYGPRIQEPVARTAAASSSQVKMQLRNAVEAG